MLQEEPDLKARSRANVLPLLIVLLGLIGASTILAYHKDPTLGFFFGLIGASVIAAAGLRLWYSGKRQD